MLSLPTSSVLPRETRLTKTVPEYQECLADPDTTNSLLCNRSNDCAKSNG